MANQAKNQTELIIRPVVTEKATDLNGAKYPVYAFFVAANATKPSVAAAIKAKYNVTPLKVAMITVRSKHIYSRVKPGRTAAKKKALAYFPAGTTLKLA